MAGVYVDVRSVDVAILFSKTQNFSSISTQILSGKQLLYERKDSPYVPVALSSASFWHKLVHTLMF